MTVRVDDTEVCEVLRRVRVIAVVGLSLQRARDSFLVAAYVQGQGYRVVPVNPVVAAAEGEVLGERCFASLAEVAAAGVGVDMVNVFRRAEHLPQVAREAAQVGAGVLWLQLGLHSPAAQSIAEQSAMVYIADKCLKIEHQRLSARLAESPAADDKKRAESESYRRRADNC